MIDAVRSAIDNAARAACSLATAEVRNNAVAAGWPSEVARSLRVSYSGQAWSVQSSDDRADDLEYGDGENVPAAAVRQFSNRPETLEKALLEGVQNRLKGIL